MDQPSLYLLFSYGCIFWVSFSSAQLDYHCSIIESSCEEEQLLDNLTDRAMNGRRCFCDEKCALFGDCCDTPLQPIVTVVNTTPATCISVPFSTNSHVGMYVRDLCSDGTQCAASDTDLFTVIPALSKRSRLAYRNILCALCNDENMKDLQFGQIDLRCSKDLSGLNITVTNPLPFFAPDYPDPLVRKSCRLTYSFSSKANITKCVPSVDACPDGTNATAAAQCRSYMRTVTYNETVYKNPTCAACNGVDIKTLQFNNCMSPLLLDVEIDIPPITVNGTDLIATDVFKIPTLGYSMTMLLDLNLDDGNVVGAKRKCAEGWVFDPWQERCRKIFCPNQQVYEDGLCKFKTTAPSTSTDGNPGTVFPSSNQPITLPSDKNNKFPADAVYCPRIEFLPNEYHVIGNTLYVNSSGHSYNLTDVIFNNSVVAVCISDEYDAYVAAFSNSEIILSIVCFALSLFCLILHFAMYILAGKTKLVPDLNMLSISATIFTVHLLLLLAPLVQYALSLNSVPCTVIGVVLHYMALASFSWSTVIAFDITKTVLSLENPSINSTTYANYIRYSLFAWLVPLISLIPAIVLDQVLPESDYSPIYGRNICWINRRKSLWIFFGAPVVLIVFCNVIFYGTTSTALWKNHKNKTLLTNLGPKSSTASSKKTQFTLYLKLAMIMSIAWITGFFAVAVSPLRYVSIIMNGLQGMYIFLAFSCKKSMIQLIVNRRKRIGTYILRINSLKPTLSGKSTASTGFSHDKSPVTKSLSGVTVTTKLSSSSQKTNKRL
ncbi:uncharacterized protein LOC129597766 [Paramacrobiotus metropolitanus]|uniref:uncharacterized protein LOC129597766 n=1 Tax=Paramacrobiotus metropolitanus TaxID=2943436 RepID=UPI0024458EA7|nr:uncharacterized protein LOC129597766 [Paramacrobiotus metropolitanus]